MKDGEMLSIGLLQTIFISKPSPINFLDPTFQALAAALLQNRTGDS
jgi:hypothetical protein